MSKRAIPALILGLAFAFAASPGPAAGDTPRLWHRYFMAGKIVESTTDGVHLCIGSADGAKVGQELDVVHVTRDRSVSPKQGGRFIRTKVGTIRITAIVDEHFADAVVTSGRAQKRDVVRLVGTASASPAP